MLRINFLSLLHYQSARKDYFSTLSSLLGVAWSILVAVDSLLRRDALAYCLVKSLPLGDTLFTPPSLPQPTTEKKICTKHEKTSSRVNGAYPGRLLAEAVSQSNRRTVGRFVGRFVGQSVS